MGRKLKLDERTVRLRTRKMEREGFIQYYQTVPNLGLFNEPLACLCNFQAADIKAKQTAVEVLRDADGIIDIADYLGESFGVTVSGSSDLDIQERTRRLAEKIGIQRYALLPPRFFPKPQKSPNNLDWRLVKALRCDALRSICEIASEVRITHRMAEYSIRRLFESKTLSTRAIINARDPKGIIFYSLNLSLEPGRGAIARQLREAYGERVWWSFAPPGPGIILLLFATSIGRAEDDLLEALSNPGVQSGSLSIFKGWVEPKRPSWIDKMIEQKIAEQH